MNRAENIGLFSENAGALLREDGSLLRGCRAFPMKYKRTGLRKWCSFERMWGLF